MSKNVWILPVLFIIFILMLVVGGVALAEQPKATWEGEFNPHSFTAWKTAEGKYDVNLRLVLQRILNPDPNAEVKEIMVWIYPMTISSGKILKYSYKRDEIKYSFELDFTKNHYKQISPKPENAI